MLVAGYENNSIFTSFVNIHTLTIPNIHSFISPRSLATRVL